MRAAVTFDFHNTLVRCDEWFELEVRTLPLRVGQELGLPVDVSLTQTYRDLRAEVIDHGVELDAVAGVVETFNRLGTQLDANTVRPVIDKLMMDLVPRSTLLSGVSESIRTLHDRGVHIGIISSAVHHDFLEWSLTHHGIRQYFAEVVSSARAGFYKSRTELYEVAYEWLGASRERSVHIGDSFRFDHLAGVRAGIATVWLNEPGAPAPSDGPLPRAEVSSMVRVDDVLMSLMAELNSSMEHVNAD